MNAQCVKKLDRLFQEVVCREPSIVSGAEATVGHHFFARYNMSLRFWIPNGIPCTIAEHNEFHGKNRQKLVELTISIRGKDWYNGLIQRKNVIAKNLKYEKVLEYLEGKAEDYLTK